MLQIILDTETTGLSVTEGHRIIEIGCIELIDRKVTNQYFHHYINPERDVEAAAFAVHGITDASLKDKPIFSSIAKEFIDFISGAELIIHNAAFDLSFLNHELMLTKQNWQPITDYCRVVDTLLLARQMHVGQRNSLDALCKRYAVDNTKRDLHGALLDANLLAQVYLAMTGGQGSFFDETSDDAEPTAAQVDHASPVPVQKQPLIVISANEEEQAAHKHYLEKMKKKGKCLWSSE